MTRSGNAKKPLVEDGDYGTKMLMQWAQTAMGGDAAAARTGVCALMKEQALRLEQQLAASESAAKVRLVEIIRCVMHTHRTKQGCNRERPDHAAFVYSLHTMRSIFIHGHTHTHTCTQTQALLESKGQDAPSPSRVTDLLEVLRGAVRVANAAPVHLSCA